MAFARYAGLRIPSEIRELKFSDFVTEMNGDASFDISPLGKTGERVVPLFDELRPHYEALVNAREEGQEYLFAKYRNCTNVGTLIKKKMAKAIADNHAEIRFSACAGVKILDKRSI